MQGQRRHDQQQRSTNEAAPWGEVNKCLQWVHGTIPSGASSAVHCHWLKQQNHTQHKFDLAPMALNKNQVKSTWCYRTFTRFQGRSKVQCKRCPNETRNCKFISRTDNQHMILKNKQTAQWNWLVLTITAAVKWTTGTKIWSLFFLSSYALKAMIIEKVWMTKNPSAIRAENSI